MTASSLLNKFRAGLSPAHQRILDAFEAHPAVVEILSEAEEQTLAERRALVALLATVGPSFEKRIVTAGKAAQLAAAAEEAAAAAAHRARVTLTEARAAAWALERACEIEQDRICRLLADGAAPIVTDALAVVRSVSLNNHLPYLSAGHPRRPRLTPFGAGEPEQPRETPAWVAWHRAAAVQHEVEAALEAMRFAALSGAEAAEMVQGELVKFSGALAPLKAGRFSIDENGKIVRDDSETLERKVYDEPGKRTAAVPK